MTSIEVLPSRSTPTGADLTLEWPLTTADHSEVRASLLWSLEQFPRASVQARDFVRIVAGAFLADSRVSKPEVSLHRDLLLTVRVEDVAIWDDELRTLVAELLAWLTGDSWEIRVAAANVPVVTASATVLTLDRVQLLSGGLDSLCGALIGLRDGSDIGFVGLRDSNNAVRHAQDIIMTALGGRAIYLREELFFHRSAVRKNHGPRSRSLFYMAVGLLVAEEYGAKEVWVPENGFTSINPPLSPARGGMLTTRSTHPYTFNLVGAIVSRLGLGATISNPFELLTKGELVRQAGTELMDATWKDATQNSYSCGVGNAQLFGTNPNYNCGLCVACVVRRGSFLAGGVSDPTPYAVNELVGSKRDELIDSRAKDLIAIAGAVSAGIDEDEILSSATWPIGVDLDALTALVARGIGELGAVELPAP